MVQSQVKFQVIGSHTMKIKYKETSYFQDKETAIKAYEEEASKYVQLGIHQMYFAELLTCTLEHGSVISRENLVDWRKEYI